MHHFDKFNVAKPIQPISTMPVTKTFSWKTLSFSFMKLEKVDFCQKGLLFIKLGGYEITSSEVLTNISYKCQLSVKTLPICQLNFRIFVSCQELNDS